MNLPFTTILVMVSLYSCCATTRTVHHELKEYKHLIVHDSGNNGHYYRRKHLIDQSIRSASPKSVENDIIIPHSNIEKSAKAKKRRTLSKSNRVQYSKKSNEKEEIILLRTLEDNTYGKGNGKGNGKVNGKGKVKGGTDNDNDLSVCSKRHFNSEALVKGRMLSSNSNKGHIAVDTKSTKSQKNFSGLRNTGKKKQSRNQLCNSNIGQGSGKGNGKGGSSKSKTRSSGKGSNACHLYDFSPGNQIGYEGRGNVTKNILSIIRGIPRLSIFVDLLEKSSTEFIFDCPGPFTALIPANRAFRTLDPATFADTLLRDKTGKLQNILLSHIIPGIYRTGDFMAGIVDTLGGDPLYIDTNPLVFNNNATTGTSDIFAYNGVIHVIDSVLLTNVNQSICDSGLYDFDGLTCGAGCRQNLIDIACGKPELSTFLLLIQLSGLDMIFECSGPFTLFVPNNDAFTDIRGHVLLDMLKPENVNELKDFLLYHVLPGSFLRHQLDAGEQGTLLAGVNISIVTNPITVNNAKIVSGDFLACNGVLHIVNNVLETSIIPMSPEPSPFSNAPSLNAPSPEPSAYLASEPPEAPSQNPSITPAMTSPPKFPSVDPSIAPSDAPTTIAPSETPTMAPITSPSTIPTIIPTVPPTTNPSVPPTIVLSTSPTIAPSVSPTQNAPSVAPSLSIVQIDINRRFFIAFVSGSNIEPTLEEYQQIRDITVAYYNDYIMRIFAMARPLTEFIEWNTTLTDTMFNAGIPNQRFNIYMEYSLTTATYTAASQNIPTPIEFLTILKEGFLVEYLLNVTALIGTPFEFVVEGVFSTV